jgi:phosphoribulokinase
MNYPSMIRSMSRIENGVWLTGKSAKMNLCQRMMNHKLRIKRERRLQQMFQRLPSKNRSNAHPFISVECPSYTEMSLVSCWRKSTIVLAPVLTHFMKNAYNPSYESVEP